MKYNIHSDKLKITSAIKNYIEEKIGKLDKYFRNSDDITARIVIKSNNYQQTIEVTIPTDNFILRNEEINEDLYAAIDLVVDKLERQIRKNKTKIQEKSYKKKNELIYSDYEIKDEEEEETKVVRRKQIDTKPMNEEEAILQMNMLGHDFFIYKDDITNQICVLYKRKDGDYGIIETK